MGVLVAVLALVLAMVEEALDPLRKRIVMLMPEGSPSPRILLA
jgi:hypothetical protein